MVGTPVRLAPIGRRSPAGNHVSGPLAGGGNTPHRSTLPATGQRGNHRSWCLPCCERVWPNGRCMDSFHSFRHVSLDGAGPFSATPSHPSARRDTLCAWTGGRRKTLHNSAHSRWSRHYPICGRKRNINAANGLGPAWSRCLGLLLCNLHHGRRLPVTLTRYESARIGLNPLAA